MYVLHAGVAESVAERGREEEGSRAEGRGGESPCTPRERLQGGVVRRVEIMRQGYDYEGCQ